MAANMGYHLLLLIGAAAALSNPIPGNLDHKSNDHWLAFKTKFNKSYESEQVETLRLAIFLNNKWRLDRFNAGRNVQSSLELGLNHLADRTEFELERLRGFRLPEERHWLRNSAEADKLLKRIMNDNSSQVPDELDWRQEPDRVSRVKDQGDCGSCWAFAVTGALEGQESVRPGLRNLISASFQVNKTLELSEQNLVDCVTTNWGCNGGFPLRAFRFIGKEGGINSELEYPYEARNGRCRFRKASSVISNKGGLILPEGDEEALKQMVAKFGPVAVAIKAFGDEFNFYKGGVYDNRKCGNKHYDLNHAVLVVGYGTDQTAGDYWIIKNSWSQHYGDNGYIKMARNRNNQCGIATMATIPTF